MACSKLHFVISEGRLLPRQPELVTSRRRHSTAETHEGPSITVHDTGRRMGRGILAGLTAVFAAATFVPLSSPSAVADTVTATAVVLNVVDGDTIDIRDDVRGRLRVRLLGIDTPETKKPGYTVGCWGPEATEFARTTMVGQRVALVPDSTQERTDHYGRTYLH